MLRRAPCRCAPARFVAASLALAAAGAFLANDPEPDSRSGDPHTLSRTSAALPVGGRVGPAAPNAPEVALLRERAARSLESFEEERADRAARWGCALAADGTPVVPDWVLRHGR